MSKYFVGWCAAMLGTAIALAPLGWRGAVGALLGVVCVELMHMAYNAEKRALTGNGSE